MNNKRITVPLKLIIDAVEMADENWNQYLDTETMEVVSVPHADYELFEDYEEEAEQIENDETERYYTLPDRFDIHEYRIIEQFIDDLPSGSIQDELARAIRGRGAFRRFKDTIRYHGIEQDWYDYLAEAYRRIAIEWCEANRFEYYEEREEPES